MGLVAGAGSTALRDVLAAGTGRVVRVGAASVTVTVLSRAPGSGPQTGPRLLVLDGAPGPSSLPCAVLVPGLGRFLGSGAVRVGDVVRLEGGGVHLPGFSVRLTRWWAPARVLPREQQLPSQRVAAPGELDAVTWQALGAAVDAFCARDAATAADRLCGVLGRGPGSTPAADDAVAGVLLAARARWGAASGPVVDHAGGAVAAAAPGRTTPLSAELLRHAAEGLATRVVVRAVQRPTETCRAAVRALGASSGAATLAGADRVAAARWGRLAA